MTKLSTPVDGSTLGSDEIQLQVRETAKGIGTAKLRLISVQKHCNNLTGFEKQQLEHACRLLDMVEEIVKCYDVPF